MTVIEADKGHIIITGETPADVYGEAESIKKRCGEIFVSFTDPVAQADGLFISIGNVVIGELT